MGCETPSCLDRKARKEKAKAQLAYDERVHAYNIEQGQKEHQFLLDSRETQLRNEKAQQDYSYNQAMKQHAYNESIRELQYNQAVGQYEKSEELYAKQAHFNREAQLHSAEGALQTAQGRVQQVEFDAQQSQVKFGKLSAAHKLTTAQNKIDLDHAKVEKALADGGLDLALAKNVTETLFNQGRLDLEHSEKVSQAMSKLTGVDIRHTKELFDAVSSGAKLDTQHLEEIGKAFNAKTGLDIDLAKTLTEAQYSTLQGDIQLANQQAESFARGIGLDLDLSNKISEAGLARRAETLNIQNVRADAAVKSQASLVETLKAAGDISASGQTGRTAAKNIQAALAEDSRKNQQISDSIHRADSDFNLKLLGIDKGLAYTKAQHGVAKATNIARLKYDEAVHGLSSSQIEQGTKFARAIHGLEKHEIKHGLDVFKAKKGLSEADIAAGVSEAEALKSLTQADTKASLAFAEASKNLSQDELTQYLKIAESTYQLDKLEADAVYGKVQADTGIKQSESATGVKFGEIQLGFEKEQRDATKLSIKKAYESDIDKINLQTAQANLQAKANRMEFPPLPPATPAPTRAPATELLKPLDYKEPPAPSYDAYYAGIPKSGGRVGGGNVTGTILSTASAVAGITYAAASMSSTATAGAIASWAGPIGLGLMAVNLIGQAADWW